MPEKRKTKKKKKKKFIVDYDLPKNSKGKNQFYRELKRLNVAKSSESVVVTNDLEKAKKIHRKASAIGKSNLYKVKKKKRKA